jgi:hypothetical protein
MWYLHRLEISHDLFNNYLDSKFMHYSRNGLIKLEAAKVHIGLYKVNSLLPEHGFILSNLTGQPAELRYQLHGKRQRRTVSMNNMLLNKYV